MIFGIVLSSGSLSLSVVTELNFAARGNCKMTLKDRIKKLCKEKGVSMSRLETDCGFGRGYVSKLDKSAPNSQKLQKIADYFDISLDDLMNGEPGQIIGTNVCLQSRVGNDIELCTALEKYYKLSDAKRKHILELISFLSENPKIQYVTFRA